MKAKSQKQNKFLKIKHPNNGEILGSPKGYKEVPKGPLHYIYFA